jgi:hypothetical protein
MSNEWVILGLLYAGALIFFALYMSDGEDE